MEPLTLGILGIVVFLIVLLGGVPIGISLGLVGITGCITIYAQTAPFIDSVLMGVTLLLNTTFATATDWVFVVLPLFMLMGFVASEAGIPELAYSALVKWVGKTKGSLAIATILGQTVFGLCTGSSIVACTVFSKVSAPPMLKYGYGTKFTYGLIAGTGSLGMIIPPSVLAIIYGLLSGESIGALFLGGVGPGLLLSCLFIISVFVIARYDPSAAPKIPVNYTLTEKVKSVVDFIPIIIVAIVIIYGLLAGLYTATEAGAIGTLTVLLIGIVTRKLKLNRMMNLLRETAASIGMVFIIFMMAKVFSRFLTLSGIAGAFSDFIVNLPIPPMGVIIGFVLMYLFLGMFLDSISIIIITVPLLAPIAVSLNMDPIWFAMVSIIAIECGLLTPPVGLNVYAVKGVVKDDITLEDLFAGSSPFFLVMLGCVILIMIFPDIITWLPHKMIK